MAARHETINRPLFATDLREHSKRLFVLAYLQALAKFIGTGRTEIEAFEFDEDGRFLFWPHAEVHLGWDQLLQIVNPAAAVAAKQRSEEFNRRYGAAIRTLREEHCLKQSQIPGLTERHLRRVEHGEQAASKATLESLASAHRLSLDEYLKRRAERIGRATPLATATAALLALAGR